LLLRVHAKTGELNAERVRRELRLVDEDPRIVVCRFDEDEGVSSIEFSGSPPLETIEVSRWQKSEFRNAVQWLRPRSADAVRQLRNAGLEVDLCIGQYTAGPVPIELIKELARLELGLYIVSLPE
jgi:hypothetical protein